MLHKMHRVSAMLIGAYVLIHLLNHVIALNGIASHQAFMAGFRHVYRQQAIEALLLTCLAFQVCSGLFFVARRWGQRAGIFDVLQAASGAYLAFFMLVHVFAVLYGRAALGLDTDFFYAAAGLRIAPMQAFFMPYYFLGVSAFVAHIACAFHYLSRDRLAAPARNAIGYTIGAAGLLLAGLIVATFSGAFYSVEIPLAYQATFR